MFAPRASCERWPVWVSLGLLLSSAPALSAPTTYDIRPGESRVDIQVFKAGVASGLAHDHVIRGTDVSGTVVYDPERPEGTSVQVTLQTATLIADLPAARKKYDLEGTLDKDDREEVEENMKGEDQLGVKQHPTITFKSTSVQKVGDNYIVRGPLTLKGKTKPILMPVKVKITGDTLTGDGKMRVLQSTYGIEPYSALLGSIENQDRLLVHVHLKGEAKPAPEVGQPKAGGAP